MNENNTQPEEETILDFYKSLEKGDIYTDNEAGSGGVALAYIFISINQEESIVQEYLISMKAEFKRQSFNLCVANCENGRINAGRMRRI